MAFDLVAALDFPELPSYLNRLEARLQGLPAPAHRPLAESLAHVVHARGKQLRPSLVLTIVKEQGIAIDDKVMAACAAVELLHIASLVHDDIIDNSASRHGVETINNKDGQLTAIIAGDYLIALAFSQAAIAGVEISRAIATAFAAMCDGQAQELADAFNLHRTETACLQVTKGKTAALFAATCRIGGICAALPAATIKNFTAYGESFGMSYQLIDDVLDFVSTPGLLGKPAGNDTHEGNYTLPLILALQQDKKFAAMVQNDDHIELTSSLLEAGTLQKVVSQARDFAQTAADKLQNIHGKLANFPETYLNWSLENFTDQKFQNQL